MTRKFRVEKTDKNWKEYTASLDDYIGKILEFKSENLWSICLFTPGNEDYWYFNKEWVTEVFEEETKSEQVHSPKHYNVLEDIEAIQIIASSMSYEMFKGYCLGNILKYRLRCGAKDDVTQELAKADKYKELFAKYKHMCKGEK